MSLESAYTKAQTNGWLTWIALWTVYIVWGSTYLAIRVVVETMPPLLSGGIRFMVAGAIAYVFLRWRRGAASVRVTGKEVGASALVGTALLLGGNGLVSIGEQEVPSGLAALIIASVPLWVIVWRFAFRDRISRGTLIGVIAGFIGVGVLMLPGERPGDASLAGMLVIVAAALFWASGSFFSKKLPLPKDPFTSTTMQMLTGGLITGVAGGLSGEFSDLNIAGFSRGSWIALIYLVFVGSLVAFTAYTWLLQNAPISKVATYAYVNPVIAIFLGWAFLSEEITATVAVGASIIVASVATIVRKETVPVRRVGTEATPAGGEVLEPSRA
jgi:drug/metabolite transporter (DMT)-like permease